MAQTTNELNLGAGLGPLLDKIILERVTAKFSLEEIDRMVAERVRERVNAAVGRYLSNGATDWGRDDDLAKKIGQRVQAVLGSPDDVIAAAVSERLAKLTDEETASYAKVIRNQVERDMDRNLIYKLSKHVEELATEKFKAMLAGSDLIDANALAERVMKNLLGV